MVTEIYIPFKEILEKSCSQSSLDFQGLRSMAESADALNAKYPDFCLSRDNELYILDKAKETWESLTIEFGKAVKNEYTTAEVLYMNIDVNRPSLHNILRSYMSKYVVDYILSWWYESRDINRSALYAENANQLLSKIKDIVLPKLTTYRLRFF